MAANKETMEVINAIHSLEVETNDHKRKLKEAKADYKSEVADLPEARRVADLKADLKVAQAQLDRAIQIDGTLNRLRVNIKEMTLKLTDLREIMSHHLVRYFEKSGRRIIKISKVDEMARQIVVTAKLGGEIPDEPETQSMFEEEGR